MGKPWEKFKPTQAEAKPWERFKPEVVEERPAITGRGLLEGTLESLPAAGALFGGALGFASPVPGGALGGAALGGALGGSAKSLLESALLEKPKTYTDVALAPVKGAAEGIAGEMTGQVAGKLISKIPDIGFKKKAPQILQSGEKLGIKPTTGMLSEGEVVKGLESSLEQSPTVGGYLTRRETEPVKKAIQQRSEQLLEGASSLSPYEAGSQIKSGLVQKIGEEVGPINMVYDDIASNTQHMGLNPKGQERIANNIRNISEVQLLPDSPGAKLADQFASGVQNSKNVKQLGLLQSQAKAVMRDPTIGAADKQVMAQVIDKIDRFQNNSIMRNAIEAARTKGEGTKIAKDIVGDIKDAAKSYRNFITKYQKLGEGSKITTGKYGASNIIREIESVPSEKLPEKLFTNQNNDFLNYLRDEFPEQYSLAKEQKLTQIFKKSTGPDGEISPKKFMTSIKSLGPEVRTHLFGENANIDDLQTLIQNLPSKVGASDTPRGLQYIEMLNPIAQGRDLLRYGAYKGLPYTQKVKGKLQGPMSKGLIRYQTTKELED